MDAYVVPCHVGIIDRESHASGRSFAASGNRRDYGYLGFYDSYSYRPWFGTFWSGVLGEKKKKKRLHDAYSRLPPANSSILSILVGWI